MVAPTAEANTVDRVSQITSPSGSGCPGGGAEPYFAVLYYCILYVHWINLQERKRGLVIAERQEKEMQRVVENEQRMAELHKKIHRVEEVRPFWFQSVMFSL